MTKSELRSKLEPTSRPLTFASTAGMLFMFKDCFKPQTTVVVGSFIQLALCAVLPLRRATAQLPFSTGFFGSPPGASPMVVFHLGIQTNHPLGLAAPGMEQISKYFMAMHKDLNSKRDEYGMLSSSTWRGDERSSNNTLLLIYYFRDLKSLHRFAHDELHRKAWDYVNKSKLKHVGIFHETFNVPAREYENVYVNCRPVLMGHMTVKTAEGVEEEERWTNSLVSADTALLKTQYARMARDEHGSLKDTE
ncbi:hypothetical protein FVEG_16265 [Fusarium verticillioides 7600]|uniref:Uncharacterized protein n=1 Tax=Gibberella moniliformis (strain M3125 / FGSC 7600) TaxID=334819 RepID=W7M9W6_GIBM7|nr:hypothetical protein FVEG_16265 [Fusarium verticillioides 7600]EWG48368.1 hypothetical protein FVEG_16265 [Fusarium verticillioides 7600]